MYSIHGFDRPFLEKAAHGKHEVRFTKLALNTDTVDMAAGFQAVALFISDMATADILQRLASHGVRFLALRSVGYDHVDLDMARQLGMRVANVPEYSPYSVAEHTIALILALNRKLIRAHHRIMDLNFSLDGLTGFDLHGKTVGIIGVGRIGSAVAFILQGFGCHLLGYDIAVNAELQSRTGLQYVDLDTLCRKSDIITLHAPLNKETHYLIGRRQIEMMKDGVMLINTSRGGLLNTKEVIVALKSGKIGYLGLDVYEEEKGLFFEDHSAGILQDDVIARLMTFPNVLITSHQAFLTREALEAIAATTIYHLNCWENNQRSKYELF